MSIDFDKEIRAHLEVIKKLQKPSGVFTAAAHTVATGYDKAWLRDNYFITVLAFLETGDIADSRECCQSSALSIFEA
jgi:hypothetical protein